MMEFDKWNVTYKWINYFIMQINLQNSVSEKNTNFLNKKNKV